MKKYESSQAEYQGEARWVLGGQDPGFPAEEEEKEEIKNLSRGEGGDQECVKRRSR